MNGLRTKKVLAISLLFFGFNSGTTEAKQDTTIKFSGKFSEEIFSTSRMNFLNKNVSETNPLDNTSSNDTSLKVATTFDGDAAFSCGEKKENPFLQAKVEARFRYNAGETAYVKTTSTTTTVAGQTVTISSAPLGKNVMWLRSMDLKISLDQNRDESNNFIQLGAFPYSLGRGIALGSTYKAGAFLGMTSRFSIDQFAPGFLLHTDFLSKDLDLDLYIGLLDNPNSSFDDNNETIRTNEIRPSSVGADRGTGRRVWVAATSLNWSVLDSDKHKLNINPYAYAQQAPDQKVEFAADTDSNVHGIGFTIDHSAGAFEWGIETALQGGSSHIKAWDRNYTSLESVDGVPTSTYSKIYTDSTFTTNATANAANATLVSAATKSFDQNGAQIDANLWNAEDRFRPEQKKIYNGWFFVFDMSYELVKNELKACLDTGIVTGGLDKYDDVSSMSEENRLNQKFSSYIPIQSSYSGRKVKHLVLLNKGVPRFAVDSPTKDLTALYTTSKVIGSSTIKNAFTNLMYVGGSLEWKPSVLKNYNVKVTPTALHYWTEDTPNLADGTEASSSLGSTVSVEVEAKVLDALSLSGYFGVMLPGRQYEQFAGTTIGKGTLGSDKAFVSGATLSYKF